MLPAHFVATRPRPMKPLHRLLALAALAVCLSTPAAAEKTVAESDFSAYKELAQTKLDAARESLQKDVQALGTRVDNQDKRIDQQGNRIGDVSISLTWFGILLTILAIIAGFVGYFTVSAKARKEAQEEADKAVKTWLSGHEAELQRQIKAAEAFAAESRTRIQDFERDIAELRAQVTEKMSNHIADFESSLEAAKQRLQEDITKPAEGGSKQVTPEQLAALQAQEEKLRHKPEADYGFKDWNNRAFAAYSGGNHEEAARYWKQAADAPDASPTDAAKTLFNAGVSSEQSGRLDDVVATYELLDQRYANAAEPALREQVAKALFNKGVTLGKLGRADDAIATYDLLDQRYASAAEPVLREQMAKARLNKGFTLLCRAKKNWLNKTSRLANLEQAAGLFLGAEQDIHANHPTVLGNRAYCAHLRGQPAEIVRPLLEAALKDGGEKLYKVTLDDLAIHPVPLDAEFRRLLDEVWVSLGNALPDASKPQGGMRKAF
jgi:TolA-binding protein